MCSPRTAPTVSAAEWLRWLTPNGEIPAAWFQSIKSILRALLAPPCRHVATTGDRARVTRPRWLGLILSDWLTPFMAAGAAQSGHGSGEPVVVLAFYLIYTLGELCFCRSAFPSSVKQPCPVGVYADGALVDANFVANLIGGLSGVWCSESSEASVPPARWPG